MTIKTYRRPIESALRRIGSTDFSMEHRDGVTLVWDEEWWEASEPVGVLDGERSASEIETWVAGWTAGHGAGVSRGRREGFANCQAGLRALLGAASAADVNQLLDAAQRART